MEAEVVSQIYVSMQDVDVSRIHFASLFSFFDRNESELCAKMGIPITRMLSNGYALPVVSTGCDYKKSFGLDDVVTVSSKIESVGNKSIKIIHHVTDNGGNLLAEGFTVHVAVMEEKNEPITVEELFIGMGL